MKQYRETEAQNIPFRKGRFFQRDGEWFLQTRENIELGPFESHAEAAVCLNQYIDFIDGDNNEALQQLCKTHAA